MNQPSPANLTKILIVGGGSAGWLTAGVLAASHPQLDITLIESPDVSTIGVGEGTWPTMRATLLKIGISETDLITQCCASFKQGSKFSNWIGTNNPSNDHYYHPFSLPQQYGQINLGPHWSKLAQQRSFADAVSPQGYLCDQGLGPKLANTPEYGFMVNYGYHLDAGKFAQLLKQRCVEQLGVTHVLDHVNTVNSAPNGDIASLNSQNHGDISADLFIDCSGLTALLIGQHYNIPFISAKHILFNDRAMVAQLPYENEQAPIASHTLSTAQSAGWIWDIGLSSRRGVGYVYSSAHQSDDHAQQTIVNYLTTAGGAKAADLPIRKISINPGHRAEFWHKNCVAVGMAAGFLEPLEASALVMIELAAKQVSEQMPANREVMTIIADRFNERFRYRWDRIIDFLKLHYVLSQRNDSDYWRDNRQVSSIPESLQTLLTLWRYQPPWHYDFNQTDEIFSSASYQYVLYGMGFETQLSLSHTFDDSPELAQQAMQCFKQNEQMARKLLGAMPSNRELINLIKKQGLPKR